MNQAVLKFLRFEVSVYAAFIALIVFIIFYRKISSGEKPVANVIFVYGFTEVLAGMLVYNNQYNIWLYNIMLIPQMLSISYALIPKMTPGLTRKVLITGVITFVSIHLINILFFQGVNKFANFTFIPSITWLAVIAYYSLRDSFDSIDKKPFHSLVTWLALATMIDNAASVPIMSVLGWAQFIKTSEILALVSIITWLYTFWYFIIIFGLIWTQTTLRSAFYSR